MATDVETLDDLSPEDRARSLVLIADLARLRGRPCTRCGRLLCGHDALLGVVMGMRDEPCCHRCLSAHLGHDTVATREHLLGHVLHRPCRRRAWLTASRCEGYGDAVRPPCLGWPAAMRPGPTAGPAAHPTSTTMTDRRQDPNTAPPDADATWDAADMGCGDLVLELRQRLRAIAPGRVVHVNARDPGAPEDLPAWCRMTGHALVFHRHPDYWIRRKDD